MASRSSAPAPSKPAAPAPAPPKSSGGRGTPEPPPKARQPPKFIYRGDTRVAVDDVFKNGIKAAGKNTDVLAHVRGGPNLSDTAYIATTQTRRVAGVFMKQVIPEDSFVDKTHPEIKYYRRTGWLYTINTAGLEMVYVPDFLEEKKLQKEINTYSWQQEWAVKGAIPAKNIKEAQLVDGYFWRFSDYDANLKRANVDAIYPADKESPYKTKNETNKAYKE
ncbi:uncharacterized protein LOC9656870 [Selaginella moellendorffii]|nr:uncharacterized protein LOC9656870 [Selaginella moellendorffii]|eukprot:XP_024538613.1 uncharacterized protein LOC9656870 [Selaginella moellendorffii]